MEGAHCGHEADAAFGEEEVAAKVSEGWDIVEDLDG